MSTKDLVNAIISGDAIEIETAFQSTMADKISAQLDIRRQEVAQNLFKTESTVVAEQSEQLDELSKTTLKSYIKKASGGLDGTARHAFDAGRHLALGNDTETDKSFAKSRKRISGIGKAVDKLTKEESEIAEETNKPVSEHKASKSVSENYGVEQLVVTNIESALYAMQEGRNVLDQQIDEAVSSTSKDNYESTHGKKPKGHGNWYFSTVHPHQHDFNKHKSETVNVTGTFGDAAKKAQAHFKEKGHKGEIHVLT